MHRCKQLRQVAQKMKTKNDLMVSQLVQRLVIMVIGLRSYVGQGEAIPDTRRRHEASDIQVDEGESKVTVTYIDTLILLYSSRL